MSAPLPPRRILVVSHACAAPLNQRLYAELADQAGWQVTLLVPRRWRSEYGERRARRDPYYQGALELVPVLGSGNIPLRAYLADWGALFRRARPDLLYVHHEAYGVATLQAFLAARRARVPAAFYSAQNLLKSYPPPFRQAEAWVYRQAALALPVSASVAEVLRAKGYRGALEVLPLAVDLRLYCPTASQERESGPLHLGYGGRLVPEKGVDVLLQALTLLQDAVLWVVGSGPEEAALRKLAAQLGLGDRVHFVGAVPQDAVPSWMRRFDLLVLPSRSLPSWSEQFGRVLIEALACGVPVIGSSAGEIPHLIAATGGGLTFPEGDASALAARAEELRAPLERAALSSAGLASVRRDYSQEVVASRLALALEEAIRRGSA